MPETKEVTAVVGYIATGNNTVQKKGLKQITIPMSKKLKVSEALKEIQREIMSRLNYEYPNLEIKIDSLKIEEKELD